VRLAPLKQIAIQQVKLLTAGNRLLELPQGEKREWEPIKAAQNYWKVLKHRLKNEGSELVANCNQLKLGVSDGKSYLAAGSKNSPTSQH